MKLLVSVRSVEEALAALEGGADVIDIKEPSRGSLGRANDATIAAVVQAVAGRRMVSAAGGELLEANASPMQQIHFVKWGLAGCAGHADWPRCFLARAQELPLNCRPVAVAYADWQRAEAPPPQAVCDFSCAQRSGTFLIDTWLKDGTTLLDHLPVALIREMIRRCRAKCVPVALAGSLGEAQIEELMPLRPDWCAVRGAACRKGDRNADIDAARVRALVELASGSRILIQC